MTDEESSAITYGDGTDKFNAKIIGLTKDGDVIIRFSPEMTQDLLANSALSRNNSGSSSRTKFTKSQSTVVRFDDESSSKPPSTPAAATASSPRTSTEKQSETEAEEPSRERRDGQLSKLRSSSATSITFKGKEKAAAAEQ